MWGRGAERPSLPGAPLPRIRTRSPSRGRSPPWVLWRPHYVSTTGDIAGPGQGFPKGPSLTNSVRSQGTPVTPPALLQLLWHLANSEGGRSRVPGTGARAGYVLVPCDPALPPRPDPRPFLTVSENQIYPEGTNDELCQGAQSLGRRCRGS